MNLVSDGEAYPIQFFGEDNLVRVKRVGKAATVCLDPSLICERSRITQPGSNIYCLPQPGLPSPPPPILSHPPPPSHPPSIRSVSRPDVTPIEIRPYENRDVELLDVSIRRPMDNHSSFSMGQRTLRTFQTLGTRIYGWPDEMFNMNAARRTFQKDPTVGNRSEYESNVLTKIIDDIYGIICDDYNSTKTDFLDELQKQIVTYLNKCFALIKGEGTKCLYVEKMINTEFGYPMFLMRDVSAVKEFLDSATKDRGYQWPPPSHSTLIFGGDTQSGKKNRKSKDIFIHPFTIWKNCDKRLWFRKVESSPHITDPLILNAWPPNAITRKMAAGSKDKVLFHADGTSTSLLTVLNYVGQVFCNESNNILNWLLDWMALVVQNPGIPTKIAPMLTGEEGNGKNFFFDMFAAILGPQHHTVISRTKIFDRFNGSIEGKSLVFVNEMDSLEKKEWSHLRELIIDPTAPIERKGQEIRIVKNVANFIFVSNNQHSDLFPDLGTTKRRIVQLTCRNVIKDPMLWNRFWEWSGGNHISGSTTRQVCHGSLALADFLYNRRVERRIDVMPIDENGDPCVLSGLQDVPQWWYDCLGRGLILGSTDQTPWDTNRTAFSGPSTVKWISLVAPFRVLRQDMYEAFKGWFKHSNMGNLNIGGLQFIRQMNYLLLGRTHIVPRKRTRTGSKNGQKAYWMIEPLLDERRKFRLLYDNISFDDSDDNVTDGGTIPIDRFADEHTCDYKALSERLPNLTIIGVGQRDEEMVVVNQRDDSGQKKMEDEDSDSSDEEGEDDEDDGDEDVDFGGPDDI